MATTQGIQTTKRYRMDYQTAEHFYNWLEQVHRSDQHEVEQGIHALLADHPELVETHSWPEMRRLVERNRQFGIGGQS